MVPMPSRTHLYDEITNKFGPLSVPAVDPARQPLSSWRHKRRNRQVSGTLRMWLRPPIR